MAGDVVGDRSGDPWASTAALPSRPSRPSRGAGPPHAGAAESWLHVVVKWAVGLLALALLGVVAVWQGWRMLDEAGVIEQLRPTSVCARQAAVEATRFAEVMGDTRPVDHRTLEPGCAAP